MEYMTSSTPRRKCAGCGLIRPATSYVSPKGRKCAGCRRATGRKNARSSRVNGTYGITLAEYAAILEAQGGGCGGCGRAPRRNENFDVDHDHALEALGWAIRETIRGLLCRACNRKVLPYARNNPDTLRRLAAYLDCPPALEILGTRKDQ